MSKSRNELKVGIFFTLCLALLATLLLNFAKGVSIFKTVYEIKVLTTNVGGIKPKSTVLMAGVPVGTVDKVDLTKDLKSVVITIKVQKRYQIHSDAIFTIEAAGFLGDQYVSIVPSKDEGVILKDGDEVHCREPFNIQEAARSVLGLIQRVDQTVQQIHISFLRIDRTLLSDSNMNNLVDSVSNLKRVSEQAGVFADKATGLTDKAGRTLDRLDLVVETNTAPIGVAVSNMVQFSRQLNQVGVDLQETVATNRIQFSAAIKNVETGTIQITNLLAGIEQGKGLAGNLLKNEQTEKEFSDLLANMNVVSSNLVILSSNITRFGLLYKPKPVKTNASKSLNVHR